ncbi:hypothetical protein [Sphingobacterium faecium]
MFIRIGALQGSWEVISFMFSVQRSMSSHYGVAVSTMEKSVYTYVDVISMGGEMF